MTALLFLLAAVAVFSVLGYFVPLHKIENAFYGIGGLITTFGVPLATHYFREQARYEKLQATIDAANGVPTAVEPATNAAAEFPHGVLVFGACLIGVGIGAWRREVALAARGLEDDPLS